MLLELWLIEGGVEVRKIKAISHPILTAKSLLLCLAKNREASIEPRYRRMPVTNSLSDLVKRYTVFLVHLRNVVCLAIGVPRLDTIDMAETQKLPKFASASVNDTR